MRMDLQNRDDVETLVRGFYDLARADTLLGPVFEGAIGDDWDQHFPLLFDFWEQILFGTGNYQGQPMQVHKALHQRFPLRQAHFDRWLELWEQNLEVRFAGPHAETARLRARSIRQLMAFKVLGT